MRFLYLALSLIVLLFDRWTKSLVVGHMALGESIPIIRNFLHFTYTQNPGIAFSLLDHNPSSIQKGILISLSLVAIGVVATLAWKSPAQKVWMQAAFALILGGATGNLWDRVAQGQVTDFIDVFVRDHHWPIFNMADSALTVGLIALAVRMIFFESEETDRK